MESHCNQTELVCSSITKGKLFHRDEKLGSSVNSTGDSKVVFGYVPGNCHLEGPAGQRQHWRKIVTGRLMEERASHGAWGVELPYRDGLGWKEWNHRESPLRPWLCSLPHMAFCHSCSVACHTERTKSIAIFSFKTGDQRCMHAKVCLGKTQVGPAVSEASPKCMMMRLWWQCGYEQLSRGLWVLGHLPLLALVIEHFVLLLGLAWAHPGQLLKRGMGKYNTAVCRGMRRGMWGKDMEYRKTLQADCCHPKWGRDAKWGPESSLGRSLHWGGSTLA